ncbi:MAG: GDP-mannose 4,6-dehydratase [FCB group bacterium]|nr:GDP-mannose 4,6-dehydratase [FCB group bacterium]
MPKRAVVTGSAGFIGFSLSRRLLNEGYQVIGIDNVNDYYDVKLKRDRLKILKKYPGFNFYKKDISNKKALNRIFKKEDVNSSDRIVNLAAQAGVRHAQKDPGSYVKTNITGFFNMIELARKVESKHFVYASSSSVYGGNKKMPFSVHHNVDHPISLYAASKKSNELIAHVYSFTYELPTTGLCFFSVYGPWGRPDMALFLFTKAILAGEPIQVFNEGNMSRDFTYIDDIVEGVYRIMEKIPEPDSNWDGFNPDPSRSWVPFRLYNIGNHHTIKLLDYVKLIEKTLGKKAIVELLPMQQGDIQDAFADIEDIAQDVGFEPKTKIYDGVPKFVEWYEDY